MPPSVPALRRAIVPEMGQLMPNEWMTVAECAELFRIHRKTIYRQLGAGTFPIQTVRIGHQWRISRLDAADKLEEIAAMIAAIPEEDHEDHEEDQ